MINDLKKDQNTYPYPHKFHVDMNIPEFIKKFTEHTEKGIWL